MKIKIRITKKISLVKIASMLAIVFTIINILVSVLRLELEQISMLWIGSTALKLLWIGFLFYLLDNENKKG